MSDDQKRNPELTELALLYAREQFARGVEISILELVGEISSLIIDSGLDLPLGFENEVAIQIVRELIKKDGILIGGGFRRSSSGLPEFVAWYGTIADRLQCLDEVLSLTGDESEAAQLAVWLTPPPTR